MLSRMRTGTKRGPGRGTASGGQIAAAYERGYGEHPQEGDELESWSHAAGASALAGLEE